MSIEVEPLLLDYLWKISNNGLTLIISFIYLLLELNLLGLMVDVVPDTLKRDWIELSATKLG
jgi:hypothetical protein